MVDRETYESVMSFCYLGDTLDRDRWKWRSMNVMKRKSKPIGNQTINLFLALEC